MKLLITGSTGFVGRNLLLHALQDPRWSAIILPVRNEAKLREQLCNEGIERLPEHLHLCAINEKGYSLAKVPSPDFAIHCAGLTFSRKRAPYFKTNVESTLALAQALPETCQLLVLSSQSAAGPTPASFSARTRHHDEEPLSWYGQSKLAMEKELTRIFHTDPDEEVAKPDETRQAKILTQGCVSTHCSSQNQSLTQYSSGFPASAVERYEISGLMRLKRSRLLILRPPMILGPRDTATLPLFQMARGALRIKPGVQPKHYSWIAVDDLCRAIFVAAKHDWKQLPHHTYFLTGKKTITDLELIQTTATVLKAHGITLRAPHMLIQAISFIADKIPALHQPLQSLGRDRVKEIFASRWVIDGSEFERDFNWQPQLSLEETLRQTAAWLN